MTSSTATSIDAAGSPSILWKAFDVLDAFTQSHRVLTLTEIARRSGLPKSTVHRVLTMLLDVQAVERVDGGYKIGIRMFTVGAVSVDVKLRELSLPHLERLRRITRQTVHLAVLRDGDAIYLEKLPSLASPQTPALVGGRLPAFRTGVGKALMAFSDQPITETAMPLSAQRPGAATATLGHYLANVRRTGFAGDREEAAKGLACVAVPIFVQGQAVAAISVAFSASEGSGEAFVNPLRETATALSRAAASLPRFTL